MKAAEENRNPEEARAEMNARQEEAGGREEDGEEEDEEDGKGRGTLWRTREET